MKAELHPEFQITTITCTCGAVYETRSTVQNLKVGICMQCHPFFTGEQRFVDTAGRVEKFAKRYGSMQARRAEKVEDVKTEDVKEEPEAASAPA
jgi:large subunit ribosomal protein L31